jgi:hypothetical protein
MLARPAGPYQTGLFRDQLPRPQPAPAYQPVHLLLPKALQAAKKGGYVNAQFNTGREGLRAPEFP